MSKVKLEPTNNLIFFISYVDASYSFRRLKKLPEPLHQTVGRKVSFDRSHLCISFCDDDRGMTLEGLVIPRRAIVEEFQDVKVQKKIMSLKVGSKVGIQWEDIIRYRNGKVPYQADECLYGRIASYRY